MKRQFKYAIKVNGKVVWQGTNPKEKYWEIKTKYPKKKVTIVWVMKEGVLICVI